MPNGAAHSPQHRGLMVEIEARPSTADISANRRHVMLSLLVQHALQSNQSTTPASTRRAPSAFSRDIRGGGRQRTQEITYNSDTLIKPSGTTDRLLQHKAVKTIERHYSRHSRATPQQLFLDEEKTRRRRAATRTPTLSDWAVGACHSRARAFVLAAQRGVGPAHRRGAAQGRGRRRHERRQVHPRGHVVTPRWRSNPRGVRTAAGGAPGGQDSAHQRGMPNPRAACHLLLTPSGPAPGQHSARPRRAAARKVLEAASAVGGAERDGQREPARPAAAHRGGRAPRAHLGGGDHLGARRHGRRVATQSAAVA